MQCVAFRLKTIESVQRRFTASLPGCKHLTYTEKLKLLHIDSLEKRGLKADLAFTYKIIFGLVNLNLSDFFTLRTNYKIRSHPYRLALANNKNTLRRNFLSVRIIKPWNLLPASNDNFNSFTSFKRFLNNCDLPKLCKY